MRCQYCHNPDTWSIKDGEEWEPEQLFQKLYRFRPYWKNKGGITDSGGEAMLQMEFVTELFAIAKKNRFIQHWTPAGLLSVMRKSTCRSFRN